MKRLLVALLLIGAALSQEDQSTRHPEDNLIPTSTVSNKEADVKQEEELALPAPVDVATSVGINAEDDGDSGKGVIPRVEIDFDGVPIVHGVVMPDDPNDTKVWRNARVLNNVLIENKREQRTDNNSNGSAIQEQGDMFVYRPESSRILNDDFQPSQADSTAFSPSLPYPAFYYQRFYQDKGTQADMPDSLAVETDGDSATSQSQDQLKEAEDETTGTDGRAFNAKKKKTGITKLTPGSSYGAGAYSGRPIAYYVKPEEAKAIHDDHSPYEYEPAQNQPGNYYTNDYTTQGSVSKIDYQYYQQQQAQQQQAQQQQQQQLLQQQQQAQQDALLQYQLQQQQQQQQAQTQQQLQQENPQRTGYYQQNSFLPGNIVQAPADAFVIRDQTYSSGGQTFSVPIPVPKDQYNKQYGQQYQQYAQQQPQYQYAYPQYYQQQQQQQQTQPLEFLASKFKEQVQKAKDRIHGMTDPVVDPLMEAGQKISTNLGLPDRVNKINEKVATPGVLVPLAMVGGAALALGGLSTAIHLSNPDTKNNVFKAFKIDNSTLADRITTALHPHRSLNRTRRAVDEDEDFSTGEYDDEKENLIDHVLSALNGPQKAFLTQLQKTGFDEWQKTPCAKRIFCDVMVQQNDDAITLMEKRMSTFLSL